MNDRLTRKKHSGIVAKLMLQLGYMDKKTYSELYMESYVFQRRVRSKNKRKYSIGRYYIELHKCSMDYWGECDEYSVIEMAKELVYWKNAEFDDEGDTVNHGPSFKSTKKLITYLRSIERNKIKRMK